MWLLNPRLMEHERLFARRRGTVGQHQQADSSHSYR
jgi:hypothetical protein